MRSSQDDQEVHESQGEINPTSVLQAQMKIRPRRSRKFYQEACSAAGCTILRKETRDWEARESKIEGEGLPGNRKAGVWGRGEGRARQDHEERAERRGEKRRPGRDSSGSLLPTPSLKVASIHQGPHPQCTVARVNGGVSVLGLSYSMW